MQRLLYVTHEKIRVTMSQLQSAILMNIKSMSKTALCTRMGGLPSIL
jgi:hypothetical protein